MFKLHKKIGLGVLAAIAIIGCSVQVKGVAVYADSQASSKVEQDERAYVSSRKKMKERELVKRMEEVVRNSNKARGHKVEVVQNFGMDIVKSVNFNDIQDFERRIFELGLGSYMVRIDIAEIFIRIS